MMKNETKKQTFDRSAGVLMSISSLPSDYGIGTMGKAAYEFADFVRACNHKYWQVLPIGSTTYGDSPYQSYSAFAGNPYFIDLDMLAEDGLLLKSDMLAVDWGDGKVPVHISEEEAGNGNFTQNTDIGLGNECYVSYEKMYQNRFAVLRKAFESYKAVRSESKVKLAAGTPDKDSIVMSVGSDGVEYSEMMNYAYLLKRQYEGNFGSELWNYSLGGNKTVGAQAKQEIVNMVTQLKVIAQAADRNEVSLTNDEKDEAMQKAEKIMEKVSDSDKKKYYLSVQGLSKLYEENVLANKMFYVATDKANTDVSDEEARQAAIQYIEIMTKGIGSSGQKIDMDEKAKAQALKWAEQLQLRAVKTKDFLTLAKDNTDATTQELVVGKSSTKLEKAALDAALALKKGEVSSVVEGTQGYYIIYCVNDKEEDATQARKEVIIAKRQNRLFQKKYNIWLNKCDVNISEDFWDYFQL